MSTIRFAGFGLALAALVAFAGCSSAQEEFHEVDPGAEVVDENPDHDHDHEQGPHAGHLIELGEDEYHVELVFDEETKKVTVYILGSDPSESHPIDEEELTLNMMIAGEPSQFQLLTEPQDDDPEGNSSRFELADNKQIAEHIQDIEDIEGRISVTIEGKQYSGDIEHEHEHAHGHDDDHHEKHGKEDGKHKDGEENEDGKTDTEADSEKGE